MDSLGITSFTLSVAKEVKRSLGSCGQRSVEKEVLRKELLTGGERKGKSSK